MGVAAGSDVALLVGDGSVVLVGSAFDDIYVDVGGKVMTGALVLTTTGLWVGGGVYVEYCSTMSPTFSAADGAQDVKINASAKPDRKKIDLMGYSPPARLSLNIQLLQHVSQHYLFKKKGPLQKEAGPISSRVGRCWQSAFGGNTRINLPGYLV